MEILSDLSYLFEAEVWLLIYPKHGILCIKNKFVGGRVSKRNQNVTRCLFSDSFTLYPCHAHKHSTVITVALQWNAHGNNKDNCNKSNVVNYSFSSPYIAVSSLSICIFNLHYFPFFCGWTISGFQPLAPKREEITLPLETNVCDLHKLA